MKKLFSIILLASTCLMSDAQNDGYRIEMKVNGLEDDTVFMAYFFGTKLFYQDTAVVEGKGRVLFEGDEPLKPGMYAFVEGRTRVFDFLVEEQEFSLKTDKKEAIKKMRIEGSPNNELFYEYMRNIQKEKAKRAPLQSKMKKAEGEEKEALKKKLQRIHERVRDYQKKIAQENPELLAGKMVKASINIEEPEVPDSLESKEEKQRFKHRYYKEHFLDNVDFSDPRLARTPILAQKVKAYFNRFIVEQADPVIEAADRILSEVEEGSEMYKFLVNFIYNKYVNSKIMGMDAVFVHMLENYYFDGKADWVDEKTIKDWKERVRKVKPLLIGEQAPLITLADTSGERFIPLKDVDAEYTILYFWDPDCGHCKKATPALKAAYDSLKSRGVEVYAVGTPLETGKWKKYIRKEELNWINVSDNPHINNNPREYLDRTDLQSMNFRQTYDIYSTPKIFLLDEDKTIIAKKLDIEQLVEYVGRLLDDRTPQRAPSVREEEGQRGAMPGVGSR